MQSRRKWGLIIGTATVLLSLQLAAPLSAQVDRATLNGTVTDATGAALAGAKVTAAHQGSGLTREAVVPATGNYVIPQLPIGVYHITVVASGFQPVRFENVQLQVGQIRTLDVGLEIAATATQVEVRDTATALDRSSAEIGSVIQASQVAQLPINGRHWAGLMLLAPGGINTGGGTQGDIRFGGRANDDNN